MQYSSTRGGVKGLTFEEALLSGYAADGGLLMPEVIPKVTEDMLDRWSSLSFSQLVQEVAGLYISPEEIPAEDLKGLIEKAFSKFAHPDTVHLAQLSEDLNILELFHGVTLAFKDLALSCVGQFLEYFLEKRQKHITIVVGTSGDTGSAALESVRGLKWVDIVVLLPKGRCSRVQELQMTTVIEDNVHVFRVDGTSDDIDLIIKPCFIDAEFVSKHNLCSINSINWARILVQIAHYFYAYFKIQKDGEKRAEIVIPTGACGNVTGGVIAQKMGLPVKLVCAVNTNDIVCRTFTSGDFSIAESVIPSLAPAMDIQIPYNMERILYLFSGHDATLVNSLLGEFERNGKMSVPEDLHAKIQRAISSSSVTDAQIQEAMRRCWEKDAYLVCPHTATAVYYHYTHPDSEIKRVCVATASPAKFEEAVLSAGLTPKPTPAIQALDRKTTKYTDMPAGDKGLTILRAIIENIYTKSC